MLRFVGGQVLGDVLYALTPHKRVIQWQVVLRNGATDMMVATNEVDVWIRFGDTAVEVRPLGVA